MSVLTSSQPSSFSPPSYSRHPITKEGVNPSASTTSIPSSLGKLSLSLTSPIRRIFTLSNHSAASNLNVALSSVSNGSSASFSTVSAGASSHTLEREHELEREPAVEPKIMVPPPTYSPIKTAPPLYERSISDTDESAAAPRARPPTPVDRPQNPDHMAGFHYGYVAESWAGSWRLVESDAAYDAEKREREEDSSCWCTSWWMVAGATSMPWAAYSMY